MADQDSEDDVVAAWMREKPWSGMDHDRALLLGLIRYLNKNGWRFHIGNADGIAGQDWWIHDGNLDRIQVPNLRCSAAYAAYATVRAIEQVMHLRTGHYTGYVNQAETLDAIMSEACAVVDAMKRIGTPAVGTSTTNPNGTPR